MFTGEGYVPRTLTQLYTWVILVFSNQWHGKGEMKLDIETTEFLKVKQVKTRNK